MWIELERGDAVNLSQAVSIFYCDNIDGKYRVFAAMPDEEEYLQEFDKEVDAQKYISALVKELNGSKPVGYAFSWLTKLKAAEADEAEILSDELKADKADEILSDEMNW